MLPEKIKSADIDQSRTEQQLGLSTVSLTILSEHAVYTGLSKLVAGSNRKDPCGQLIEAICSNVLAQYSDVVVSE